MTNTDRVEHASAPEQPGRARRSIVLLFPLLLILTAASAALVRPAFPAHPADPPHPSIQIRPPRNPKARPAMSQWSAWQPAMAPDGSPQPVIQFHWRSDPPCTDIGCRLSVEIRNTSNAPVQLRCSVYIDPPPEPYEDEVRPVIIDALLKASGTPTAKGKSGDTTNPLMIPGISITGVVIASTKLN